MQSFDIVINGGGMVGLSLACGLQGTGLCVGVIERQGPATIPLADQSALRVSAINAASRRLLQHLQVWDIISAQGTNPYRWMEFWEKDSYGRIIFDGTGLGYSELGHIIEHQVIQQALWRRAEQLPEVTLMFSAMLRQVDWGANEACLTLDDGRMLTARLVVAADGAHSWLRTHADIPLIFWDDHHHALVATVRTARAHGNIIRQTFHDDGILAFLPLSDPHLSSIIWSLPPSAAKAFMKASIEKFNAALAMHFSLELGLCCLQSDRQLFQITGRYARHFAAHRLVLVGDAAHTLQPLAGQGLNLGFMDVAALLGEIRRLRTAGKDISYYPYLRRYERSRKYSAALMLMGMQGLRELFCSQHLLKKWVRVTGLRLVDTLPSVKQGLIKQAMGLNDLPAWLAAEPLD